jgi:hypothetical protein
MNYPRMTVEELVKYHEMKVATYKAIKQREIERSPELNDVSGRRIDHASYREAFHLRAVEFLRTVAPRAGQ